MEKVYQYIEEHRSRFIEELQSLLRFPSTTANSEGVRNYLEWIGEAMRGLGLAIKIFETPGNPVLYGKSEGQGKTPVVLLYGHGDVMPAEDLKLWESPPFEPSIRHGRVYARGAGDNKAQHLAHLKAIEALNACGRERPRIKFLLEGEEETGSPGLPKFVADHLPMLQADVLYAADGARHESNRPTLYLGCRGVIGIELMVEGATMEVHSGRQGNMVPNMSWRLIHVLSSLRDSAGQVLLQGFQEDVVPPSAEERRILQSLPYNGDRLARELGVADLRTIDGNKYYEAIMFRPTINICGLVSGYTGPGIKTIIPNQASAKIDIRLVPNQGPDKIIQLFKDHLIRHGFGDVTLTVRNIMKPSRTSVNHPYVSMIGHAVREATGEEPVVFPSIGGSVPQYVFADLLGIPCIWSGYANWDENAHGPNENIDLDCFIQAIKISANVLHTLATSPEARGDPKTIESLHSGSNGANQSS